MKDDLNLTSQANVFFVVDETFISPLTVFYNARENSSLANRFLWKTIMMFHIKLFVEVLVSRGPGRLQQALSHESSRSTNLQRIAYNKTNVGNSVKEDGLVHAATVWILTFSVWSWTQFLP